MIDNPAIGTNLGCCPNASGGSYIHPCACPQITLQWTGQSWSATMFGFPEFGTPSSPPQFYLTYSTSGGWTYTNNYMNDSPPVASDSIVGAGIGATNIGYNSTGGSLSGTYDATQTDHPSGTVIDILVGLIPGTGLIGDPLTGENNPGGGYSVTGVATSKTVFTLTQTGWTYNAPHSPPTDPYIQSVMGAGTFTMTLNTQCTDVMALSAAPAPHLNTGSDDFGSGGTDPAPLLNQSSLYQSRTGSAAGFLFRTMAFVFYLTGLMVGSNYVITYKIYQRTNTNNGSTVVTGAWTLYATNTISFTASGTTETTSSLNLPGGTISAPATPGYEYQIQVVNINFA